MGLFTSQQLGIEITTTAVRVVGLSGGKKPTFIGCKELPLAKHDPAEIVNALKQAFKAAAPRPLKKGLVNLLIPEKTLFRKTIDLPHIIDPNEQREAIRLEIGQYLPEDAGTFEFDYQPLAVSADKLTDQCMVVTAPQAIIEEYQALTKKAGLQLQVLDTVPPALGRAIVPFDEKRAVVIVSIEPASSTISLYQQGKIWVSSGLNMGMVDEEIDEAHYKVLSSSIVDEIEHIVKFYMNRSAGEHSDVLDVRLVGSGPVLDHLKDAVVKNLEQKVVVAKAAITVPAFCDSRFFPALGAALYMHFEKV